jgi:hypothetical protein
MDSGAEKAILDVIRGLHSDVRKDRWGWRR